MDLKKARVHLGGAIKLLETYSSFPDALQVKRALDELQELEKSLTLDEIEVKDMLALFPAEDYVLHLKHEQCLFEIPHFIEVCGFYTPLLKQEQIIAKLRASLDPFQQILTGLQQALESNEEVVKVEGEENDG